MFLGHYRFCEDAKRKERVVGYRLFEKDIFLDIIHVTFSIFPSLHAPHLLSFKPFSEISTFFSVSPALDLNSPYARASCFHSSSSVCPAQCICLVINSAHASPISAARTYIIPSITLLGSTWPANPIEMIGLKLPFVTILPERDAYVIVICVFTTPG